MPSVLGSCDAVEQDRLKNYSSEHSFLHTVPTTHKSGYEGNSPPLLLCLFYLLDGVLFI